MMYQGVNVEGLEAYVLFRSHRTPANQLIGTLFQSPQ